ncbi:MAG TPA: gamma-glutamyltransferase, partial [Lacunisphaera sp.]
SSVTIPGAGFLMNNEMDDFTTKLGEKNLYGLIQGPANSILPGKRPLSSMTPTLVLKDGHLVFATGSPGGSTIITVVFGVITNVLDHGMTIRQAVDAPRFHHQWMPDVMFYERNSISPDTAALLKARGQKIEERENVIISDAETVAINPKTGLREGASDIRKPDSKTVGY